MEKSLQEEAQKTKIINAREDTNAACIKYSLHVNHREIDQEKQNKTVAR